MPSPEMHGLVLAGGEGSRLAADGVAVPKPMVAVAGRAQAVHLVETLLGLGCPTVTCMVRDEFPDVVAYLAARAWPGSGLRAGWYPLTTPLASPRPLLRHSAWTKTSRRAWAPALVSMCSRPSP